MKQLYLVFLFTCTFFVAFSQVATIDGTVRAKDGNPIGEVTIKIEGLDIASMTNSKGRYELRNVPYGKYSISVTSIEIEPKRMELTVSRATHRLDVEVEKKDQVGIEEVTVNRMTQKKEMETSGFAVAVIETKEASLRNLTTNELLDRAVGVRVRQNGGIGSQIEYNLNGMSGSAVGIFLDGTPISTFGSSFNLNNIPPAMIERIEVYKGVLPSHLTGDYVGGAINVIMKKDATANNVSAAVSYGSFNTFQADLGALYRDQKTGFTTRISGFYTYTDNSYEMWGKFAMITDAELKLKRYQRVKRFNDSYKSIGGRFEFGFTDVKWADRFLLSYNISDTHSEIPHGTTMAQPYVGRFQEFQANVFQLNYIKRDLFIDGLSLNVDAVYSNRGTYLQDTARTMYNWDGKPKQIMRNGVPVPLVKRVGEGQQGAAVITNVDREIINARTNVSYMVAQGHRLSLNHNLNATSRKDTDLLNPNNPSNSANSRRTSTNILGFNYEAQTLGNKLRTNLLVKYTINQNHYKNTGGDVTVTNRNPGYGATVSYNVIPSLFIIGSTENTYISPRDEQIYGNPEANILENLDLVPEKNVNYNLGFRYSPLDGGKHRLSLYANTFWRNGYDKIAVQSVDSVIVGRENDANIETTKYINLGRTQSRGFEAEIIYVYNNRLNALVNFSKFRNLFKQEFDDAGKRHAFYDRQLPNEPFFTVNASVQYRFDNVIQKRSVFNLYYNTGYVGSFRTVWYDSDGWFTTPTQFHHDIGGSYRTPKGTMVVSLDIKNIFNAEMYDNFGVQKPGRGYFLKLNYMINHFNKK